MQEVPKELCIEQGKSNTVFHPGTAEVLKKKKREFEVVRGRQLLCFELNVLHELRFEIPEGPAFGRRT